MSRRRVVDGALTKLQLKSCGMVLALVLSACSSVPLTSLPKLRGLKPETVDMAQLEMAVRLPQGVGIPQDSAVLNIRLQNDQGRVLDKKMRLQAPIAQLTDYLEKQQGDDHRIYRFKLTGDQLSEAQIFREEALEFSKRFEGQTGFEFSAATGFCSDEPDRLYDDMTMTFYIRTKSDKEFFKLFKERTLVFKDESGLPKSTTLSSCQDKG